MCASSGNLTLPNHFPFAKYQTSSKCLTLSTFGVLLLYVRLDLLSHADHLVILFQSCDQHFSVI